MLADENVVSHRQRHRVLQMPADGESRSQRPAHPHRKRGVAPGAPQHQFTAKNDADDGIVNVPENRTIVHQEPIRNRAQPPDGVVLVGADRFVGDVAACGYDGESQFRSQEVVQRRVRQHRAEVRIARRHCGRDESGPRLPAQQHDRGFGRKQQPLLQLADLAGVLYGRQTGKHQGKGLLFPVLALPQPCDRRLVRGVHDQVESTETLDGYDPACADHSCGLEQRRVPETDLQPGGVPQLEGRAAVRAGVRLSVEAPVPWVPILTTALRAHLKTFHRGVRAIVRQRFDDREARAAVRAVRERIPVTAVARVEDFGQTLRTGGDIGQNQGGLTPARVADANLEMRETGRIEVAELQALDEGPRGLFPLQAQKEPVQRALFPFGLDENPLGGIQHPAGQPHLCGEPIDKGPEPDPLNRPANDHMDPLSHDLR